MLYKMCDKGWSLGKSLSPFNSLKDTLHSGLEGIDHFLLGLGFSMWVFLLLVVFNIQPS
jgi:hypothetical protein